MQISDYRYVYEDQRIHLETIYIVNDEVISSSRTPISRELDCIQEYQLRKAQDVVRYNAKTDRGIIIRDSECIYDEKKTLSLDAIYSVMIK